MAEHPQPLPVVAATLPILAPDHHTHLAFIGGSSSSHTTHAYSRPDKSPVSNHDQVLPELARPRRHFHLRHRLQ